MFLDVIMVIMNEFIKEEVAVGLIVVQRLKSSTITVIL